MQRRGSQIFYSPSGLGNFVACEHLTQLDLVAMLGESTRPARITVSGSVPVDFFPYFEPGSIKHLGVVCCCTLLIRLLYVYSVSA